MPHSEVVQVSPTHSRLGVTVGLASTAGRRSDNQDFAAFHMPNEPELSHRGAVFAVADGVGGHKGGRVAAELGIRGFLEGYYALPDTLGVEPLAARALAAINLWIHAQGNRDPALAGMASTFSAVILRGRQCHVVHLGDSRIYRLRAGRMERFTEDHTLKQPDQQHVLYRALGIEAQARADHAIHSLQPGDRLLLCSDGLHGTLRERIMQELLAHGLAAQHTADQLLRTALERGSQDNITAIVVDVLDVPAAGRGDIENDLAGFPLIALPKIGTTVDGFYLLRLIADGHYSRLYLAEDRQAPNHPARVLKFPQPRVATEAEYRHAFVREAWIGGRVHSPWVAEILSLPHGRQTALYSVMPFLEGQTLAEFITARHPIDIGTGAGLALKLCKAVYALHRQRIIHRDIKPENVFLLNDGGLKLLDLGVARLPGWENQDANHPLTEDIPGTPSFMAPEQFHHERGTLSTDIYSLGVTLFFLFTRHYPYGEIEPFSTPRFQQRKRLNQFRPDLPTWLDQLLHKTVSGEPAERPQDSMELAFELEQGLTGNTQNPPKFVPFLERNPLLFWQMAAGILLILLLVTLIFY